MADIQSIRGRVGVDHGWVTEMVDPVTPAGAVVALYDAAAWWSCFPGTAAGVVAAACDALVAGVEAPSLGMLAALSAREADVEVPELLPAVLAELGLAPLPRYGSAGEEWVSMVLAARLVSGRWTARELAREVHRLFGHRVAAVERLARLDDEYDLIELGYDARPPAEVDAEVLSEARRLVADGVMTLPRGA